MADIKSSLANHTGVVRGVRCISLPGAGNHTARDRLHRSCATGTQRGPAPPGDCISVHSAIQFHRATLYFAAALAVRNRPPDRYDVRRTLCGRGDAVSTCGPARERDALEQGGDRRSGTECSRPSRPLQSSTKPRIPHGSRGIFKVQLRKRAISCPKLGKGRLRTYLVLNWPRAASSLLTFSTGPSV